MSNDIAPVVTTETEVDSNIPEMDSNTPEDQPLDRAEARRLAIKKRRNAVSAEKTIREISRTCLGHGLVDVTDDDWGKTLVYGGYNERPIDNCEVENLIGSLSYNFSPNKVETGMKMFVDPSSAKWKDLLVVSAHDLDNMKLVKPADMTGVGFMASGQHRRDALRKLKKGGRLEIAGWEAEMVIIEAGVPPAEGEKGVVSPEDKIRYHKIVAKVVEMEENLLTWGPWLITFYDITKLTLEQCYFLSLNEEEYKFAATDEEKLTTVLRLALEANMYTWEEVQAIAQSLNANSTVRKAISTQRILNFLFRAHTLGKSFRYCKAISASQVATRITSTWGALLSRQFEYQVRVLKCIVSPDEDFPSMKEVIDAVTLYKKGTTNAEKQKGYERLIAWRFQLLNPEILGNQGAWVNSFDELNDIFTRTYKGTAGQMGLRNPSVMAAHRAYLSQILSFVEKTFPTVPHVKARTFVALMTYKEEDVESLPFALLCPEVVTSTVEVFEEMALGISEIAKWFEIRTKVPVGETRKHDLDDECSAAWEAIANDSRLSHYPTAGEEIFDIILDHLPTLQNLHHKLGGTQFIPYRKVILQRTKEDAENNKEDVDRLLKIFAHASLELVPESLYNTRGFNAVRTTRSKLHWQSGEIVKRHSTAVVLICELNRTQEFRPKLLTGGVAALRQKIQDFCDRLTVCEDLLGDDLDDAPSTRWEFWDGLAIPDVVEVGSEDDDEKKGEREKEGEEKGEKKVEGEGTTSKEEREKDGGSRTEETIAGTAKRKEDKGTKGTNVKADETPAWEIEWNKLVAADMEHLNKIIRCIEKTPISKPVGRTKTAKCVADPVHAAMTTFIQAISHNAHLLRAVELYKTFDKIDVTLTECVLDVSRFNADAQTQPDPPTTRSRSKKKNPNAPTASNVKQTATKGDTSTGQASKSTKGKSLKATPAPQASQSSTKAGSSKSTPQAAPLKSKKGLVANLGDIPVQLVLVDKKISVSQPKPEPNAIRPAPKPANKAAKLARIAMSATSASPAIPSPPLTQMSPVSTLVEFDGVGESDTVSNDTPKAGHVTEVDDTSDDDDDMEEGRDPITTEKMDVDDDAGESGNGEGDTSNRSSHIQDATSSQVSSQGRSIDDLECPEFETSLYEDDTSIDMEVLLSQKFSPSPAHGKKRARTSDPPTPPPASKLAKTSKLSTTRYLSAA